MAKSKKQPTGPHLSAAFFCEKMLKEADGVATFIRMVDILMVPKPEAAPLGPDGKPIHVATEITAIVVLKSGNAKGESSIKLVANFPSGDALELFKTNVVLVGDEKGVNIYAQIPVPITEEGLYWYDVVVDGETITRMPLRIKYVQPPSPTSEAASEPGSAARQAQRNPRKKKSPEKRV